MEHTVHRSVGRPFRRQHHPPNTHRHSFLRGSLLCFASRAVVPFAAAAPNIVDGLASKVKTNKHGVLYNAIMVSPPTPISLVVDQLVSSKKSSIPGAALFLTLLVCSVFNSALPADFF